MLNLPNDIIIKTDITRLTQRPIKVIISDRLRHSYPSEALQVNGTVKPMSFDYHFVISNLPFISEKIKSRKGFQKQPQEGTEAQTGKETGPKLNELAAGSRPESPDPPLPHQCPIHYTSCLPNRLFN